MRTPPTLVRAAAFWGFAAALALAGPGCGRKEVSARTQPPKVSKWKCHLQNEAGIPKGIVVEEQGSIVRARLCDLKPGAPFDIESTLSYGTHFPARKAIIFPLGMPDSASVEQWMQAGGAHLSVVFDANASRLTGDFLSSSGQQSLQFTRYQ